MYSRKLFSLINIALLFSTIYGKVMTKDEVLKFDTSKYKDTNYEQQCPDFAYDYWDLDRCNFKFYCKDDICASLSARNTTIEIPNKEGKMIKYIVDTCTATDIGLGYCESEKCTADSQCLSNKCIDNHCAFNEANPIVHCQDAYQFHTLLGTSSTDMHCGAAVGDKCKKDDDCASRICETDGTCKRQYRDHYFDLMGTFFIYGLIIIILSISCCVFCCCKFCGRTEKSKKEISPV